MSEPIQTKQCSKCKQIKPIMQFSKDKQKRDGLCSHCKECQLQYFQKHRVERLRYDKLYYQQHRKYRLRYGKQRYQTLKGHLNVTWHSMLHRCTNSKDRCYKHYGGRGIKVKFACFEDFFYYVVKELKVDPRGLTIDRIKNDGHYERGNIRFVSNAENARNRIKRRS